MKKLFLLFLLFSGTIMAAAPGTAELTWTGPTQNVDGSAIPATGPGSLAGFKIYHSTVEAEVATSTPIVVADKTATTYTITGLPGGKRYYAMSAYTESNEESDLTGPVFNVVESVSIPLPPVFTVETTVYNVVKRVNSFLLLPVGTINVGISCNPDHHVNGYNAVPRENVTWSGTIRPDVVVAKCLPN